MLRDINSEDAKKILAVMLLTDGMVTKNSLIFFNNDLCLHNIFEELIKLSYAYGKIYTHKKRPNCYKSFCNSRNIVKDMQNLSFTYKTTAGTLPNLSFLMRSNKETLINAIKLVMSAEGAISITRRKWNGSIRGELTFACAHPDLLKQWKQIFEKVGLRMNIVHDKYNWAGIHGLRTTNSNIIKRFYELGGFVEGNTIHRGLRFKNCSKNSILEAFIKFKKGDFSNYCQLNDKQFWRLFDTCRGVRDQCRIAV